MIADAGAGKVHDCVGALQRIGGQHAVGRIPLDLPGAGGSPDERDDVVLAGAQLAAQG